MIVSTGNALNLEQLQCQGCEKTELEDMEVMDPVSLKFKLLLSKTIFIVLKCYQYVKYYQLFLSVTLVWIFSCGKNKTFICSLSGNSTISESLTETLFLCRLSSIFYLSRNYFKAIIFSPKRSNILHIRC